MRTTRLRRGINIFAWAVSSTALITATMAIIDLFAGRVLLALLFSVISSQFFWTKWALTQIARYLTIVHVLYPDAVRELVQLREQMDGYMSQFLNRDRQDPNWQPVVIPPTQEDL